MGQLAGSIFTDLSGRRRLRWVARSRLADAKGELRHGDYDIVDPELADFDRLPVPNFRPPTTPSIGAFPPGTTWPYEPKR